MRPGATALCLLSVPLNVHVVDALETGQLPLAQLKKAVGHPPATTMRGYLKALSDIGAIERRQEGSFPGAVGYSMTESGRRLLGLASILQYWLNGAPDGPIALGSPAARSAIKALVEGWNANIVRIVAARPLALTALARLIPSISYPTLERRVGAMRRVGLLQASTDGRASRGTPYEATHWLREAAAPLTAAIAWERRWARTQTSAIGRLDVEASFLLTAPLLQLPADAAGVCRLGVEMRIDSKLEYSGAVLAVDRGRLLSCSARLKGEADGWATGSVADWFGWTNRHAGSELEFGGDVALARDVAEAMRDALLPLSVTENL